MDDPALWGDTEGGSIGPNRFDWFDLVVIGAQFWCGVARAAAEAAHSTETLVAAHANWRAQRRHWAANIGQEIEAMSRG